MRRLIWAMALVLMPCCLEAGAGEPVSITGRATDAFQYPKTDTICLLFEDKDKKQYYICDDVTPKDLIEKLFALGKKDTDCQIEGAVSKKVGNDVYLGVTRIKEGS